ncbi:MAG: diaminopropionate ammonia-lyase [Megasphaera sp.]|uniref:diaminopropionate ammonia-lyase n=1 Tax=unclassified Megasphaera TaxID=2626256 RepID=UPI003A80C486
MQETIKAVHLDHQGTLSDTSSFSLAVAQKVQAFHQSFPDYQETPLADLKNLAACLGVQRIHVKDESYRFGLNAFKGLGGSFCIASYIAKKLGVDISELSYEKITSPAIKEKLGPLTFVTATDGNHGRGIAWTANRLGQKAVIYMPKGSAEERLHNIQKLGAEASITDLNYDDTVRFAAKQAEANGWVFVQDTAWDGYTEIPGWIMQGYMTMAYEAYQQLRHEPLTHIFLQAGVGAMSGALTGFFSSVYGDDKRPIITIVEPNKADCIYRTAAANDGTLHVVKGDMDSIMAGLCCGEPCTIGWDILKDHADHFVSVPDWVAAKGMRVLGNPMGDDPRVISGESGAVTTGFVAELLQNPSLRELREQLQITEQSDILCFSTEGDTDKENYRRIVWDGLFPSF